MRWSRFTPVARPSLEIVHKVGPGYRCAERFDGQKRGCEGNIFMFDGWFRFKMWGIWGCGVAARHHIYRLVRTAGSFGSGSPKKEIWGAKVSSSGGFCVFVLFFFCAPRGRRG